jgi:hypothetical protein
MMITVIHRATLLTGDQAKADIACTKSQSACKALSCRNTDQNALEFIEDIK